MVFHKELQGKLRGKFASFQSSIGNIGSQAGTFVKDNPLLTGLGLGGIAGLGVLGFKAARRRKSAKRKSRRSVQTSRRRLRPRRQVRRRGRVQRRTSRRIVRGRGLGRSEIKHSGRGTSGTKVVSFRTKDGRNIRFKVKGTSKRRRGFVRKRTSTVTRRTRRRNISNRQ